MPYLPKTRMELATVSLFNLGLSMQEALHAVIDELKRLKSEGVESVYLSDNTLPEFLSAMRKYALDYKDIEPTKVASIENLEMDQSSKPETPAFPSHPDVQLPEGSKAQQWGWLRDKVLACPVCNEYLKPGKQLVFGVGNLNADIFFCGEAPGAEEEDRGEPFVGPAGQLLTKIIKAMGLDREQVYIGNIMNWRPETATALGNRPPSIQEMAFCLPYLRAQIQIVQPKVLVALGKTTTDGLLGPDSKRRMSAIRGQWQSFMSIPLMVTFHPSYLLRNNSNSSKRQVWEDMLLVMEKLALPISDKQRNYFQ